MIVQVNRPTLLALIRALLLDFETLPRRVLTFLRYNKTTPPMGARFMFFFFLSKTATLSALFPAGLFCFVVVVVFKSNATQKIEVDKTIETSE